MNQTKFTDSKSYSATVVADLAAAGFEFVPPVNNKEVNTHSRLAAGRAALEALACHGRRKIWDVGGHKTRHTLNKRVAHCTQPGLTPTDRLPGDCAHTAMNCGCVDDFDVIILVHSAYYLSEDEMWRLADQSRLRNAPFYSVEHRFTLSQPVGKCDEAEFRLRYGVDGKLHVRFAADEIYEHPLPTWFLKTRVVSVRAGEALVRSYKSSFSGTELVNYGVVPVHTLPVEEVTLNRHWMPQMWNLIPGLLSLRVMVQSKVEFTDVEGGYQADFSQSNSYTAFCEGFPLLGDLLQRWWPCTPSQIWPVAVPKELVTYLQNTINSKTTMSSLVEQGGNWCRQNSSRLVEGVSVELVKEVAAQKAFCQDRQLIVAMRSSWAAHSPRVALVLAGAFYLMAWWTCKWACLRIFSNNPPSFARVVFGGLYRPLTVLFAIGLIALVNKAICRSKQTTQLYENRLRLKRSVESEHDVETLARSAIPGSIITLPDPAKNRPRFYGEVIEPFNHLTVQVYNTSSHNTTVAVIGRFLKPKPTSSADAWRRVHRLVAMYTAASRLMADIPMPPQTTTYEDWIMSRPLPKQRRNYAQALQRLLTAGIRNSRVDGRKLSPDEVSWLQKRVDANNELSFLNGGRDKTPIEAVTIGDLRSIKSWDLKKAFVKVEKTFVAGKLPRVIVGADDVFQVFCGPEIHRFDEALQVLMQRNNIRGLGPDGFRYDPADLEEVLYLPTIHFVVGWSQGRLSREIGEAIDRAAAYAVEGACPQHGLTPGNQDCWYRHITIFVLGDDNLTVFCTENRVFFMMNDFSSYDTTHSRQSWQVQALLMRTCGVRSSVIQAIEDTTKDIRVTTVQHGGMFSAHYNMCSGNPNTCNGNSSITAMVSMASVYEVSDHGYVARDPQVVGDFFKSLGFDPKVKFGTLEDADFLSGILVRNAEQQLVWIPKVFRLAVKSCFVADPRPGFSAQDYQKAFVDSYARFDFVPVIRSLLKLYGRLSSGANQTHANLIRNSDRNSWYSPSSDDVVGGDIDASFCAHYGITQTGLLAVEYWIEHWDTVDRSVKMDIFETCFTIDVPDYQA